MCYGSPAVTGSLTHCETGNSAALFNNQPPRLQPLNRCMFPFLQDQKTKLLICLRRRGDDRSRAQNSQCGCQPDHPWRRRWEEVRGGFARLHRRSWLCWTDCSSPASSTCSARWCSSVSGGNRGALFTDILCLSSYVFCTKQRNKWP